MFRKCVSTVSIILQSGFQGEIKNAFQPGNF